MAKRSNKPVGTCENCDAKPRALNPLTDERMVCNQCVKALRSYERLWANGVKLSRKTTPEAADQAYRDAFDGGAYIREVWDSESGLDFPSSTQTNGEPVDGIGSLTFELIKTDLPLLRSVAAAERECGRIAAERFSTAIIRPEYEAKCRPAIEKDALYSRVVILLESKWPGFSATKPEPPTLNRFDRFTNEWDLPNGAERVEHFRSYLAGTRYKNADGSSRNRLIRIVNVGDKLSLEDEDDNPHDPNAIKVLRGDGRQIGYLPRDKAAHVRRLSEKGFKFACFVEDINEEFDNSSGYPSARFIDLVFVQASPGVPDAEAQRYVDRIVTPEIVSYLDDDSGLTQPPLLPPRSNPPPRPEYYDRGGSGCLSVVVAITSVTIFSLCWLVVSVT